MVLAVLQACGVCGVGLLARPALATGRRRADGGSLAAGRPAGAATGWRRAALSMSCAWSSPFRPTTPVTSPDRLEGTEGADVFTRAGSSPGACTDSTEVPKAASTAATEPLTGSRTLPASGWPTLRPSPRSTEETWATSAADGPNSAAYWAGVR